MQPPDATPINIFRDATVRRRGTLPDARQQAPSTPHPPEVVLLYVQSAEADLDYLLQRLHPRTRRPVASDRTINLGLAVRRLASYVHPRKILAGGDDQVRKRFVVLELLVVLRLHVLDQPRLHQQGIDLAGTLYKVDVADL